MPFIYITGISGSGKSTVKEVLAQKGYTTYGIDEDGFGDWINIDTRQTDPLPHDDKFLDIHHWFKTHKWTINEQKVRELAETSNTSEPVFLCGNANDDRLISKYFDIIILLELDKKTMLHRLQHRQGNEFGKHPDEVESIVNWYDKYYKERIILHTHTVDSTKPIDQVCREIIEIAETY